MLRVFSKVYNIALNNNNLLNKLIKFYLILILDGILEAECINCAKIIDVLDIKANLHYSPNCAPYLPNYPVMAHEKDMFAIIE